MDPLDAPAPVYVPFEWGQPVEIAYADLGPDTIYVPDLPLDEADFDAAQHLRDRMGRFRDMPDMVDVTGVTYDRDVPVPPLPRPRSSEVSIGDDGKGHEQITYHKSLDTGASTDTVGMDYNPNDPDYPDVNGVVARVTPTFDADVQKITTSDDANRYMRETLGLVESDLTPPPGRTLPSHWYQEVVQASKDALARFPSLRNGKDGSTMKGVRILHERDPALNSDPEFIENAWAYTGGDPRDAVNGSASFIPWPDPHWTPTAGGTYIGISPADLLKREWDVSDFASLATSSIYGRLTHEFGHAVVDSTGLPWSQTEWDDADGRVIQSAVGMPKPPAGWSSGMGDPHAGEPEARLLSRIGLTPSVISRFSNYGASSPPEAFAEAFAMLNTPGALDVLRESDPEAAEKLLAARAKANRGKWGKLL